MRISTITRLASMVSGTLKNKFEMLRGNSVGKHFFTLKGKYHEMVCQLRPLLYSLGLNNPPRICLTPRKSRVKNLWRNKQGNCRCKMAGAGIWSFAKFRGQMPLIATSWQTALKWTANCQVPCSGCRGQIKPVAIRSQIYTLWQSAQRLFYSWQSAF
jgi:hypothetical protein